MVLVLDNNPGENLSNSNLKLADLFLPGDTLLEVCPEENMVAPRPGLDNTPIVLCSKREASIINLLLVDLLCTHALPSRQFCLNPSVLYHPVQENFMDDDASCLFDLTETTFLAYMFAT